MNDAHLHLALNHFPIILPLLGLILMLSGIALKSEIIKRAAFFVFNCAALTCIAAYNTGEGAEEIVEEIQGIEEHYIEEHEEIAETFAILVYILGGISLIGLWANWKKKSFSNLLTIATVLFSFVVLFIAKETGTTGGEIRHSEIRAEHDKNAAIHAED